MNPNDPRLSALTTPPLDAALYDLSNYQKTPNLIKRALAMLIDRQKMANIVAMNQKTQQGGQLSPEESNMAGGYTKGNVLDMAIAGAVKKPRKPSITSIRPNIESIEDIINNVLGGNFGR